MFIPRDRGNFDFALEFTFVVAHIPSGGPDDVPVFHFGDTRPSILSISPHLCKVTKDGGVVSGRV